MKTENLNNSKKFCCWIIDCQTGKRYWSRDFSWYEDAEIFGKENTDYEYEVTYEIENLNNGELE